MPPKLYGPQHIIYIVVFLTVFAAAVLFARFVAKTEKRQTLFIKIVAGVLFALLVFNRIALAVWHENAVWLLPNTYCGMSSLLLPIFVIFGKPHHKMFDFLYYFEIIGGISAVFYPYFIGQGDTIFFAPTISGLLHHSVGFILCVLMVQCKWFSPSLKRWSVFPVGLGIYTLYGLFLLDVCKMPEAMLIDAPIIAGTPLKWWFILIFGSTALYLYLFLLEKLRERKRKNADGEDAAESTE